MLPFEPRVSTAPLCIHSDLSPGDAQRHCLPSCLGPPLTTLVWQQANGSELYLALAFLLKNVKNSELRDKKRLAQAHGRNPIPSSPRSKCFFFRSVYATEKKQPAETKTRPLQVPTRNQMDASRFQIAF